MLRCVPFISDFFGDFYHKGMLSFVEDLFCIEAIMLFLSLHVFLCDISLTDSCMSNASVASLE